MPLALQHEVRHQVHRRTEWGGGSGSGYAQHMYTELALVRAPAPAL